VIAPTPKPRLLFFYSSVDGMARRTEAHLAQVLQRRRNHSTFELWRIDTRARPDLAEKFRISSAPTLLVVDGKRVRARLEGPRGCAPIAEVLAPWLR
jgi:thioredoxin-like negative regulator of GroEL